MKRFFLSHPLFSNILLVTLSLLPIVVGFTLPFVLEIAGVDASGWDFFFGMLGGPLLSLVIALPWICIPYLRCINDAIDELYQLKRARKVFHAPTAYQTVQAAETAIKQHLQKQRLEKQERALYFPTNVICKGIWKEDLTYYRKYSLNEVHPTYYMLYTADRLGHATWEELKKKLNRQMLELEGEGLRNFCSKSSYAVCILCNEAETSLTRQMQEIQRFQLTNAHVCIGVVPKNEWYLPSYSTPESESSKLARALLGKATFGLRGAVFPYKNNTAYVDAYYQKLELYCNSRISDLITEKQRKSSGINAVRNLLHDFGKSQTRENIEPSDDLFQK